MSRNIKPLLVLHLIGWKITKNIKWAWVDLNYRLYAYQAYTLTN